MIFEKDFNIGVKDIGKNNYIKNRAILEMLENIGAYHSDAAGYGANDIKKNTCSMDISRMETKSNKQAQIRAKNPHKNMGKRYGKSHNIP